MTQWITALLLLVTSSAFAIGDGSEIQPSDLFPRVKIETTMGDIVVELDRIKTPITTNNFLLYVSRGNYKGTIFHRVVKDFVVQGGGYDKDYNAKPTIRTIFNESGSGNKNEMYTIAMAREKDPHTANRQFYFNVNNNPSLDPGRKWGYAVFGRVMEGTDVLDKMAAVETHTAPELGWSDVPKEPIVIEKTTLLKQQF